MNGGMQSGGGRVRPVQPGMESPGGIGQVGQVEGPGPPRKMPPQGWPMGPPHGSYDQTRRPPDIVDPDMTRIPGQQPTGPRGPSDYNPGTTLPYPGGMPGPQDGYGGGPTRMPPQGGPQGGLKPMRMPPQGGPTRMPPQASPPDGSPRLQSLMGGNWKKRFGGGY